MSTLNKNINQTIQDFDAIREAIIEKGVDVPAGTSTSQYAEKIGEIETGGAIIVTPENYISVMISLFLCDVDCSLYNRTGQLDYSSRCFDGKVFRGTNGAVTVHIDFGICQPSLQQLNQIIESVPNKEYFMAQFTEEELEGRTECHFLMYNALAITGVTEEWCETATLEIQSKGWDYVYIPHELG